MSIDTPTLRAYLDAKTFADELADRYHHVCLTAPEPGRSQRMQSLEARLAGAAATVNTLAIALADALLRQHEAQAETHISAPPCALRVSTGISQSDGAHVVQIDSEAIAGRIRVNLNDAAMYDADPDARPGCPCGEADYGAPGHDGHVPYALTDAGLLALGDARQQVAR